MITIYKYELRIEHTFKIEIPRGCFRPIHIGEQNGKIYMWAEVNTNSDKVERTFHCFGTGESIIITSEYLGSVVRASGVFVWHFYWYPNDESL